MLTPSFVVDSNGRSFFYLMKKRGFNDWIRNHIEKKSEDDEYVIKAGLLLNCKSILNEKIDSGKTDKSKLLQLALKLRAYEYLQHRAMEKTADFSLEDPRGRNILNVLLLRPTLHIESIKSLLETIPSIDQRNSRKETSLELLLRHKDKKKRDLLVTQFITHGASVTTLNSKGLNSFQTAITIKDIELYLLLSSHMPTRPNFQARNGNTILHLLCAKGSGYPPTT